MAKKETDIEDVKLTFGNVAKVVGAIVFIVSVAGSYFNLFSRQEAFEQAQKIQHQVITEQLADLKTDAKASKEVMQSMQMTLQRTNVILEQMEKKQ